MDHLDVLGDRPERRVAFTRELLAETDDADLQEIVEQAAHELSAPIALVTLVLDHVQLFKAHCGLPPALAAARGTDRDVSFCQYVVRDERPFEVVDAANDPRVPQHLVREYDVRAYLGMPIRSGDVVVGSLCVLDTRERRFSDADRSRLEKLAWRVDERLRSLVAHRRSARLELTQRVSLPALAELRHALAPIRACAEAGIPAGAAVRSFLRLATHLLEGGSATPGAVERALDAARRAMDTADEGLAEIETSVADCEDCLVGLERLVTPGPAARLGEILESAQDLARHVTRPVGNAPLPARRSDARLRTPRSLAVALVTAALSGVATRLAAVGSDAGIRWETCELEDAVEIRISAPDLSRPEAERLAAELAAQVGPDPSFAIGWAGSAVVLTFAVAGSRPPPAPTSRPPTRLEGSRTDDSGRRA